MVVDNSKVINADDYRKQELQILSAMTSRLNWLTQIGATFGGERDLYNALGWKKSLSYNDYWWRYDRQDIARRIVNAPVNTTWRGELGVLAAANSLLPKGESSRFESEWKALEKRLRLVNIFARADKLCRVGEYSALLLGFDDVTTEGGFREPVGGVEEGDYLELKPVVSGRRLLYVKVLGQGSAEIYQYNENPNSPRYWLPELYQVKINKPDGTATKTYIVHYTRIIHVAEDVLENELFGVPSLKAVFNRLEDLEKIVGGSAEMFWRGARPGYAAIQDPDTDMTPKEKEGFSKELESWTHDLTRFLRLKGIDVKSLAPQVSSPKAHVDAQLQMISAVTGIPLRILIGSERGELASTSDDDNYFTRIAERRADHAEPNIIRPFLNRLITYGVLPNPGEYVVEWEDLWSPSDKEKGEIAKTYSEALSAYFRAGMEDRMGFGVFLREVMGFPEEVIEEIGRHAEGMEAREEEEIHEDSQETEEDER